MGNHNSKQSDSIDIEDKDMDSLIDEVSAEIDDDYKHEQELTCKPPAHRCHLPNFVKPIESIFDLHTFQSQIGRGVSGSVYLSQCHKTGEQHALKRMPRSDPLNLTSFLHETKNLQRLNHPNVVNFKDAYVSNQHYFVTTEYCSGGTLYERIIKMKRFSERDCVAFMKTILEAIRYIHSKHIVHRDLKLSNIVFDKPDIEQSKLKIIDFGESEHITNPQKKDRHVIGSICFLPPETNRTRTKQELYAGDMWALGVIAYTLIEGVFPYRPKDSKRIKEYIDNRPLVWNENIPVSDACKDFIQCLLHKDVNQRFTAEQALRHKWITNQAADKNLGDEYFQLLQNLNFQNKLQRVMVKAVLNEMSETNKQKVLRHDESVDDGLLINIILSSYTPTASKSRDSKRYSIVFKMANASREFTHESLNNMDSDEFDHILAEIDAETKRKTQSPNSPMTPSMDDEISTDTVVDILRSSTKRYDIPKIVRDLSKGGAEPITFRKISGYHQPMESLHDF